MATPEIFRGIYDPLPMYQLATLCRANSLPSADVWLKIGRGLRRHLLRTDIFPGNLGPEPTCTLMSLADYNVLVVGATAGIGGWLADAANVAMVSLLDNPSLAVGTGFWQFAQSIKEQLDLNKVDYSRPMVLVGYSLGGAVASCLAYMWNTIPGAGDVVTISFGSPRVGSIDFVRAAKGNHARCVNNADLITSMPARGVWLERAFLGPVVRMANFSHESTCLWFNGRTGQVLRIPDSQKGGLELFHLYNNTFRPDQPDTPAPSLVARLAEHSLFRYVLGWRAEVRNAERFVLEGFDQANSLMNAASGVDWPFPEFIFTGHATKMNRLPEDPIEVLPFPALVPEWDPAAPPPPQRTPEPAWVPEQRAFRRRRNIG